MHKSGCSCRHKACLAPDTINSLETGSLITSYSKKYMNYLSLVGLESLAVVVSKL